MPKPGLQEMTGDRAAGMQDHLNKDRAGTPHHISILRVRKLDELSVRVGRLWGQMMETHQSLFYPTLVS